MTKIFLLLDFFFPSLAAGMNPIPGVAQDGWRSLFQSWGTPGGLLRGAFAVPALTKKHIPASLPAAPASPPLAKNTGKHSSEQQRRGIGFAPRRSQLL